MPRSKRNVDPKLAAVPADLRKHLQARILDELASRGYISAKNHLELLASETDLLEAGDGGRRQQMEGRRQLLDLSTNEYVDSTLPLVSAALTSLAFLTFTIVMYQ